MKRYILYTALILSLSYSKTIEYFVSNDDRNIPDIKPFDFRYNNQDLVCYPAKTIHTKTRKTLISFSCIKKNIPVTYIQKEQQVSYKEQNGRDETKKLKLQIKDKENVGVIYHVDIPKADLSSLWLTKSVAKQQLNNTYYTKYLHWLLPAKFYISIRPQLSNTQDNSKLKLRDGGSRAGFFYYYDFDNGWELTTQYEATIKWDDLSSFINLSTQSNTSRRLSYISLGYDRYTILAGKYWSAYYDIASYTDKFMAYGALASGAFNNKSDGASSGTGRAEHMIQLHIDTSSYNSTIQIQTKHKSDTNLDTKYAYGISASYEYLPLQNIKLGMAFNYAKFEDITAKMKALGINGDESSVIGGISYTKNRYTINATLSYSQNHMNDDKAIYFDGYGFELYMHYDYTNQIRLAGGYNYIKPKYNYGYKSHYKISDAILSLQYTFNQNSFDDLVYVELSIPNGRLSDGQKAHTSISIGMRYLISL